MNEREMLREMYLEAVQTRMLLQDLLELAAVSAAKVANPLKTGADLIQCQIAISQPRLLAIEAQVQTLRARLENAE